MSAITGIVNLNKENIPVENGIRMKKCLEDFPFNQSDTWHKNNVYLGCHAQWITPESKHEKLPFYNSERKLAITSDAIIDNRDELFSYLQVEREKRESISDSELILLSYCKWEEDSPKYLVGDFAFLIWDERKQKLFGARDFSGSRTLYFHRNNQRIAISTIIEPLLQLQEIKKELNDQWLAEYIAISSVVDVVDTTITPYKHIEQLPPSHSFTIVDGKFKMTRYCTLSNNEPLKLKSNFEYEEAFQEVFQEAINSRLRTYKNVGAHLSGGLDSGTVASFAANGLKGQQKKLHTYSYIPPEGFEDFTPKYRLANETPYIQSTADYLEGTINNTYLDFESKDPFLEIDNFLEIMEMPYKFFENSIWLKGIYEKAHQDGVGVLLNGGRGNLTISWGPALEYYSLLLKQLKWIHLYKEVAAYSRNYGVKKSRTFSYVSKLAFPIINQISQSIKPYKYPRLINSEFANRTNVFEKLSFHGIHEVGDSFPDIFEDRKRHFQELFHWNATNTLSTKLSLRYGLWKRDPTNDLRVIRFCLSVPEEQNVQNGFDRSLIRRSTVNYLPDKVRLNQKYRGVQGVDWVHRMSSNWNHFVDELDLMVRESRVFEYLDEEVIKTAILKVKEGPRPERATDPYYRIAIRGLIINRFISKFH